MNVFIIIFITVSTLLALATVGYIIVDVTLEKRNSKTSQEFSKQEDKNTSKD